MTRDEIRDKAAECLSWGLVDPSKFAPKLAEFLTYAYEQYDEMDDDAKEFIDRFKDGTITTFAESAKQLPDSPERRALTRQLAIAGGKHHKVQNLTLSLSAQPEYEYPIIQKAEPVFFSILQQLLDVLHDAAAGIHRGAGHFSTIGLMYWNVDELLVAFHLAQRKYSTQAYSHIRNVHENLDKIELFHKEPKWADVWASSDRNAILKELAPSAVRKKLGKPKFDPLYAFFSEFGTHGTFRGVQGRVAKRVKNDDSTRIRVSVWVGGVPREDQLVSAISSCISAVRSTLLIATQVFVDSLNKQEVIQILQVAVDQSSEFLQEHFIGWATEEGFDVTELLAAIQKKPTIA